MDFKSFYYLKIKSKLPVLIATLAIAVVGSILFLFFRGQNTEQKEKISPKQTYRMQIKGLCFERINQGRKEMSIVADRFIIRKGKIGFFSTGITSTARIENARIDIYAIPQDAQEDSTFPQNRTVNTVLGKQQPFRRANGASLTVKAGPSQNPTVTAVPGKLGFGDLFGKETFNSLVPAKNISNIEAIPVTVRLHGDRGVLTQVSAASASVRLKDRKILFNGRVRVSSAGAYLSTERLVFDPLTASLITDQSYSLQKGGRTVRGSGLTTDIFLVTIQPPINADHR